MVRVWDWDRWNYEARNATIERLIIGPATVTVVCGVWQNPRLVEDSYALKSGESNHCDVNGSEISEGQFDKAGRVQLRGLVRSSSAAILANLEIFDSETAKNKLRDPPAGVATQLRS